MLKADPFILNLDRCNQRCLFCMKEKDIRQRERLTYATVSERILRARDEGYRDIDFFGGEPTCFNFLKRSVLLANRLGLKVTLATNALRFSSRSYADDFFSGTRVYAVRTSLHGLEAPVHDAVTRRKGSFRRTLKGIAHILEYNQRVCVNIVITRLNVRDIASMPAFIRGLGVRQIKFSGMVLDGGALLNRRLNVGPAAYLPYLLKALENSNRLGFSQIEVEHFPEPLKLELLKIIFRWNRKTFPRPGARGPS